MTLVINLIILGFASIAALAGTIVMFYMIATDILKK